MPCRSSRFKEDRSLQKCKPCLDCGLINRFQKGNCSTTSNALCGDCLPGWVLRSARAKRILLLLGTQTHTCVSALLFRYYRKTKLSGFQDMECIPCGDPPPPYEPHCKHPALLSSHQWSFSSHVAMTRGSTNMAAVARSLEQCV